MEIESLIFEIKQQDPVVCRAVVHIPRTFVQNMYHQAALSQQYSFETPGFKKGHVSLSYIKQHFATSLINHVKEFLFKFFVTNTLYKNIYKHKIVLGNYPRLQEIVLQDNSDAHYFIELPLFQPPRITEWKYFPFKAPKRKNYKDLDRQVELFIKEERELAKQHSSEDIAVGDWVKLRLSVVNEHKANIFNHHSEYFWIPISAEEVDVPLHSALIGKVKGDTFFSSAKGLQESFSAQFNTNYSFHVEVIDILPYTYFSFDLFKRHFRTKTNKEMSQKLIEVFSYRNDISQRRAMVEEALKLIFSKYRFAVPNYLVLRQQKLILESIQHTPDYQVYRAQKDFKERLRQLAEKQIKERVLIDQIAYHEKVQVTDEDIKSYLNLMQRQRMKEFIYFKYTYDKCAGQEILIPEEELRFACLREKTLNFIIYHLTSK